MSAILSGKMRIDTLPVSLESVVKEAIETVRPQAAKQNIGIELAPCERMAEVVVSGDRTRLVQVFWNLLTTPSSFPPESSASASPRTRDGAARVHVGMRRRPRRSSSPHVSSVSAADSQRRDARRLGIGPGARQNFVEAHGALSPRPSAGAGRGSRFTLTLAARPQANCHGAGPARRVGACEIKRISVLISILADLWRAARGVRSCAASAQRLRHPRRGSQHFSRRHFDLIISDIGLPT